MVKGDLVTQVSSWCNVFFKFLINLAVSLSWHQNQNLAMNLSSSNGFWDINLKLKNNLVETQICFVFSRKMHNHVKWLPKREYQFHNVLIIGAYLKDHLATPFVRLRKPFRHKGMLDNNRFGLKRKEHMF